jgi:flavin-dependent dehydrogenase
VQLLSGRAVTQLVIEETKPATVSGVVCGGEVIPGELVVDAGGRRSPARRWLEEAKVDLGVEERSPCGIAYSSRYFRRREGVDLPAVRGPVVELGDLGYMGYGIGPADAGTYSVLFAFPTQDKELRVLTHRAAWDAAAQLLERPSVFVDPAVGTPLMDPAPMHGLENVLSPWFGESEPVVRRFAAIGDSWLTTDPLFGWGASFALAHGFGLADAVNEHHHDVESALLHFHEKYRDEVEQRFALSCQQDRARLALWSGSAVDPSAEEIKQEALLFGLTRLAKHDTGARRALLRRQSLLALPNDVLRDHALMERVRTSLVDHPFDPFRTTPGPDRAALLDHLSAA